MGKTINTQQEVVKTIHDTYRKHIISVTENNTLSGFEYADAMNILRWIEAKRNITMGLNMSCGSCLLDLVKIFASMEE